MSFVKNSLQKNVRLWKEYCLELNPIEMPYFLKSKHKKCSKHFSFKIKTIIMTIMFGFHGNKPFKFRLELQLIPLCMPPLRDNLKENYNFWKEYSSENNHSVKLHVLVSSGIVTVNSQTSNYHDIKQTVISGHYHKTQTSWPVTLTFDPIKF